MTNDPPHRRHYQTPRLPLKSHEYSTKSPHPSVLWTPAQNLLILGNRSHRRLPYPRTNPRCLPHSQAQLSATPTRLPGARSGRTSTVAHISATRMRTWLPQVWIASFEPSTVSMISVKPTSMLRIVISILDDDDGAVSKSRPKVAKGNLGSWRYGRWAFGASWCRRLWMTISSGCRACRSDFNAMLRETDMVSLISNAEGS
jgi:hypothetical protein